LSSPVNFVTVLHHCFRIETPAVIYVFEANS
jgi:hypothetical protein